MSERLYRAAVLHALDREHIEFIPDGCLVVDNGRILACGDCATILSTYPSAQIFDWRDSLLIPGLVDAHAHLPQLGAIGCDREDLLRWLDEVIFPHEARFADIDYTRRIAEAFFRRAIAGGTTTLAVYAPPHEDATDTCFRVAGQIGIRVLMGMTLMDSNAPAALLTDVDEAIAATDRLASRWHGVGRIQYCITPRFAGSCSRELLRRCGDLAKQTGLPIQTHLAESPAELRFVSELFPDCPDYTSVYERAGLITDRTIVAHCVYLSSSELDRLGTANVAIAHCPLSNVYLQSGLMPLVEYLDRAVFRIGLGTDIGAGYAASILDEARAAREQSKVRRMFGLATRIATMEEAFYLATLGGATAVGLADTIGNFAVGKYADFVRIEIPPYRVPTTAQQALELVLYTGSDNIVATAIEGELLWQRV